MILEIHGAGFKNKGAEMMLRTATSELRERIPEIIPAIDPSYGGYEQRAELGLRQILPLRTHVGGRRFSWRFKHQKVIAALPQNSLFRALGGGKADNYGCVTLSEIDGFIDISGFAYSSLWGDKPAQDLAQLTRYYKKHQKPIILLPQAFGPFDTQEISSAVQEVVDNATLIFARDAESLSYLQELAPQSNSISQAPDITLFFPRKNDEQSKSRSDTVGIVPNARMLDQGKDLWGDSYYNILSAMISDLLQRGVPVEILVHDASGQDRELAEELRDRTGAPQIPIVAPADPMLIKRRIGEYNLLVGSRYHSLVAALSSAVPVITLGWAHKYGLLMDDFGLSGYRILPGTSIEETAQLLDQLLQKEVNDSIREQISDRLEQMSAANQAMWQSITAALEAKK